MEPRDMMGSRGERAPGPAAPQPVLLASAASRGGQQSGVWSSPPPRRGAAGAPVSPSRQPLKQRAADGVRPLPAARPPVPEALLAAGPIRQQIPRLS